MEFFNQLLSRDFTPHGFCYLWDPRIVWLHVISDGLITLSYYCIPIVLVYFIRKNRDLPFNRIFWMFGGFILACGTTHLMEIWNVWHGSYLLAGVFKAITAAVSLVTVAMLILLVPRVISLPGHMHPQAKEIEERARAEAALKESLLTSEAALKELADQKFALDQHAIVAVTDVESTITSVNEKFCAISQYPKQELIGQNHRILNSGHHPKEFFQQMYQTIANGKVWQGEIRNRAKDGSFYWVATTIVPTLSAKGKPRQYIAIRADITERKRAEEALRESLDTSEAALKELADQKFALDQHAIVAVTDVQGTITYVNEKFCAISQYPKQELIGQNHRILNSGHHPKEFFQQMYQTIANGKVWQGEIRNRAKDGSFYWVATTIVPTLSAEGKPRQYVAIRADITERKQAEESLKKSLAISEQVLKDLADQKFALDQHAIVAITDVQGTITYVNEKFCAISQYSEEELIGQNHRILNSGHHPKEFFQQMYHTIANGKVWHGEIENRAKDGSTYWVDTTIVPFVGKESKPYQYVAIRADITERKRGEGVRERLAAAVELSDDAIISRTLDGTITAWNPGAERLFGYPSSEILGKPMQILVPLERTHEESDILMRIGRGEHVDHFETVRIRKDGRKIDVSVTMSPIKDSSGAVVGASKIARDITQRRKVEEALHEQSKILDLAQVLVRDMESRIVLWSLGVQKLYGFTREEAVGRISDQLLHTQFPEPLELIQGQLERTGTWEGELVHRKRDGGRVVVSSLWVLHRDAKGNPARVLEANTDITARKDVEKRLAGLAGELSRQAEDLASSRAALEAQSLMLQSVLDSMAEGLVAADEQGKFLIWNRVAERIVGYGPADLPAEEWSEHYGNYLPDGVTPMPTEQLPLVRAMHGEASTAEIFLRSPKVTQGAWIEASGSPLRARDGTVHGGVVAFRDITKRKADERQIQQLNDELEHRVGERTAQLEIANKELEAFSYSVSHDLRAPLRHISGFSQLLVEEFGSTLDPNAQQYLERIQAGAQKMGVLVDELLNLARVGRHALRLQPTQLNGMVAEVIAILQPDCEGRQVEWMIADLPTVECDPVLVKQIFQNLLANALKFTRPRARAVIEVSHKEEDGQPVFMVRDNGVGFNMKYIDKLFGVFQRLHRAEEFEGTGIGLVTVQRIVRKHGGKVWAEGGLDKGAAFYFTLGVGKQTESKDNAATAGGRS